MQNRYLLSFGLLLFIFSSIAQPQPVANLTIFSEDGDKFFLILNGERQNNVAQTNLRVEDLLQPYYNTKVIFEDKTLGEISKNALYVADGNGIMMDVTYKIKKDKNNGKMSLKYFSMIPVQQNYVAPPNVTVVRYGNPVPATTVTQTTTTQTVGNTVGTNVNVGGLNMNVTVTDPLLTGTVKTTTTQTTTSGNQSTTVVEHPVIVERHEDTEHHHEAEHHHHIGCKGDYPMHASDFSSAVSTITNQGFDETRLSTAKQIATGNCLSAGQVSEICQIFGFEQTKLDFAKFAYDRCTEPQNYFNVNNVFSFSSSTDELNQYIQNHH